MLFHRIKVDVMLSIKTNDLLLSKNTHARHTIQPTNKKNKIHEQIKFNCLVFFSVFLFFISCVMLDWTWTCLKRRRKKKNHSIIDTQSPVKCLFNWVKRFCVNQKDLSNRKKKTFFFLSFLHQYQWHALSFNRIELVWMAICGFYRSPNKKKNTRKESSILDFHKAIKALKHPIDYTFNKSHLIFFFGCACLCVAVKEKRIWLYGCRRYKEKKTPTTNYHQPTKRDKATEYLSNITETWICSSAKRCHTDVL